MNSTFRKLSTFILIAVSCAPISFACGKERWAVKTLTDADVTQINQLPRPATVTFLGGLPQPTSKQLHQNERSRLGPPERTTFVVKALLLGFHHEKDEDFHLVLADPDNPDHLMIAEIPAPNCVNDARLAKVLGDMRMQLVQQYGSPGPRTARLTNPIPILIRGIGFYDFAHGQDGLAPNAIELHPVLGLRFLEPAAQ